MKKVVKGPEPALLTAFRQKRPDGDWEACKRDASRKRAIQAQLRQDQRSLCAYCEIHMATGTAGTTQDLRVEHFHPQSDTTTHHNWALDWQNLLACCHGGSERKVPTRFTLGDFTCDVPKQNRNLDQVILNPLHLPDVPLFNFTRAGEIQVDTARCTAAGVDPIRAQATITELRLDAKRLRRLREAELNAINDRIFRMLKQGETIDDARKAVAQTVFTTTVSGDLPSFFSAVRDYLGQAAEQVLAGTSPQP